MATFAESIGARSVVAGSGAARGPEPASMRTVQSTPRASGTLTVQSTPHAATAPTLATTRPTSTRWSLTSLSLAMLLASLGTSVANIELPALAIAFDASFQQVQWVILAYLLAITTLIVSAGRLGDIIGRKRLFLVGIAVFGSATIACAAAPTLHILVASRGIQGAGAALMMALSMALVGETVPRERTGSAMGLLGTMSAVGTALGPSLGGVLLSTLGWRAGFFIMVPIAVAALLLGMRTLPPDRTPARSAKLSDFDVAGTLVLAFALASYALSVTLGRGSFGWTNAALLTTAVFGAALFLYVERRAASPLVRVSMLRDRGLSAGLAMSAIVSTVLMSTMIVGPFHLSRALALDPAIVGVVMAIGPLVAALVAAPAGRAVDRFGASWLTVAGLAAIAGGCIAVSLLPATLGVAGYAASIVVVTAGYALFQTANNTAMMAGATADRKGVVSGLASLSRNLGLITGASLMSAVFALAAGGDVASAAARDIAGATRISFGVATLAILVALGLAVAFIGRRRA